MDSLERIKKIFQVIDVIDTIELIEDHERGIIQNVEIVDNSVKNDEELSKETIPKFLRDSQNPLEIFTNEEFKQRYSLSKETVLEVLSHIFEELDLTFNRNTAVPPLIALLLVLKFYASGKFQTRVDDLHGVSQATMSRTIVRISGLLSDLKSGFIKYPSPTEVQKLSKTFYDNYKFPNIFGCLGATHIEIKKPSPKISDMYLNEHGNFSLNVQVICGPNMEFLDCVPNSPGFIHESNVFNMSDAKSQIDNDDLGNFLLASSSYPQIKHLLTPIKNPKSDAEIKYNNLHNNTYNVTQAIEHWTKRFKCLNSTMAYKEETIKSILNATAVLHNIAVEHKEDLPPEEAIEPNFERIHKVKRSTPIDKPLKPDPEGITDRNNFIKEHFNS